MGSRTMTITVAMACLLGVLGPTQAIAQDADGDGYTVQDGDCDDTDPNVIPGGDDPCDGVIDHNCNGVVDEACIDGDCVCPCFTPETLEQYWFIGQGTITCEDDAALLDNGWLYLRADDHVDNALYSPQVYASGDQNGIDYYYCYFDQGYYDNGVWVGDEAAGQVTQDEFQRCWATLHEFLTVDKGLTCDGTHGSTETQCDDGVDNDGDGDTDGIDMDCWPGATCDPVEGDEDGDGYTTDDGDCDDTNPAVHPGATEVCEDLIDNDCDQLVDEPDCTGGGVPRGVVDALGLHLLVLAGHHRGR